PAGSWFGRVRRAREGGLPEARANHGHATGISSNKPSNGFAPRPQTGEQSRSSFAGNPLLEEFLDLLLQVADLDGMAHDLAVLAHQEHARQDHDAVLR